MTELKVSGHLMTLEPGLFCVVQSPGSLGSSGLPGVRLSRAPGAAGRAENVTISGFAEDGWLSGLGDAALVRVSGTAPAQVLVTVYQAPGAIEPAPSLQVLRLLDAAAPAPPSAAPAPAAAAAPVQIDMLAHVAAAGDVGARLGEWLGQRGSKRWIEGFAIAPVQDVAPAEIEYQAVLGRGWLSPWVEGGQFCGSRGMALPILGLKVRLRGSAAERFDCLLSATFVDGSAIGPVVGGEACESESLAPVEAFQLMLRPRSVRPVAAVPEHAAPPSRVEAAQAGATSVGERRSATAATKPPGAKPKAKSKRPAKPKPAAPRAPKRS
jgi:hypothetical protein